MLCSKCQKNPATIHYQTIVMGQKTEIKLCQDCIFKLDNPEIGISFENIFKAIMEQSTQKLNLNPGIVSSIEKIKPTISCPKCTLVYEEFKAGGKIGCASCYDVFSKEIEALFKNVQGSTKHGGKFPKRLGTHILSKQQTCDLKKRLQTAITEENFEEAAKLRDEIRALESVS